LYQLKQHVLWATLLHHTSNSWNNTYNVVLWNRNTNTWRPVYWLGGNTNKAKKKDAACGECPIAACSKCDLQWSCIRTTQHRHACIHGATLHVPQQVACTSSCTDTPVPTSSPSSRQAVKP
jgi:hypothetical protein